MNFEKNISILEALLFASGEPVSVQKLSEVSGLEKDIIHKLIDLLNDRYEKINSSLKVINLENTFQLCTRKEYSEYIKTLFEKNKNSPLSNAAMEVLSIIAYNQPVTRSFIENIRGVDSTSIVNKLIERGLIEESGRLDVPGKPIIYVTNNNFLRCFGLGSIHELPPLNNKEKDLTLFNESETNNN